MSSDPAAILNFDPFNNYFGHRKSSLKNAAKGFFEVSILDCIMYHLELIGCVNFAHPKFSGKDNTYPSLKLFLNV